jgi:apolipoprotein N-acyltransferase
LRESFSIGIARASLGLSSPRWSIAAPLLATKEQTMRSLLAALAVIVILLGVVFYAAGWMTYRKTDSTTTIELKTDKIEQAAEKAAREGRELLDDVLEPKPRTEHPVSQEDPHIEPDPVVPPT